MLRSEQQLRPEKLSMHQTEGMRKGVSEVNFVV